MPSPDRSRSRSPDRQKFKKSSGGFKWKEKRPRDDERLADTRAGGRLERGYRDRSPPRPRRRENNTDRSRHINRQSPPLRSSSKEGNLDHDNNHEDVGGGNLSSLGEETKSLPSDKPKEKKKKEKKPKSATPSEPMIIVNINDRLGTKAAIPCLASDSIKAFKAVVAAHIGRQPYEIMIKRQGERPMKDMLTLEDYGVSSGVQLDLEIDTGD